MKRKACVELLAPAGNMEAFLGAVNAGADAVYLGGNRFGARAFADNFSEDELIFCIRYAHLFGKKVYLTVNTLIKESEFSEIYDYIKPFYEAGLDGIIVQDIGVLTLAGRYFPGLSLHASTQMTITGVYGAEYIKSFGISRIVPARELSLLEIKDIKDKTGLEVETFIHGAMCYSYSGQCLFSSILGGRSGNRGRCAQPCRLLYSTRCQDRKTKDYYPLSLKDMCTIDKLPLLLEAGIDSLKIEGRMKKPEYAAGVTAVYRKYIDKYYDCKEKNNYEAIKNWSISKEDMDILSNLYIRSEIQDGYYFKHNSREMVTLSSPAYSGSEKSVLEDIRHKFLDEKRKIPVKIKAEFITGKNARIVFAYNEIEVEISGDIVQAASKQPISAENIEKQLAKLGGSAFFCSGIDVKLSENAFYPLKDMNVLRRRAVLELEKKLIESNGFEYGKTAVLLIKEQDGVEKNHLPNRSMNETAVSVKNICHLEVLAKDIWYDRVYIDSDILNDKAIEICRKLNESGVQSVISLPYIIRKRDEDYLNKLSILIKSECFQGVLVRSIDGMGYLHEAGYEGRIFSDAGFYVWNEETAKVWSEKIELFCLPYELNFGEQKALALKYNCEKVLYGRIPMMLTANCIAKTSGIRCINDVKNVEDADKCKNIAYLTDRYQKVFPVLTDCIRCMNIIYNSVPLSLHNEVSKWAGMADFRIDLTIEGRTEAEKILSYWKSLILNKEKGQPPYGDYTTGHEKRGVE